VIERGTNQVAQIVDDVLDFSRMARGLVQLRRTTAELSWIVARALEVAGARDHVVGVSIPSGLAVDADIDRMTQVVATLLGHAAQHTPRGGRIAIAGDAEGNNVRLVVRDSGSGIAPDALPSVFEPSSRNGLALAIVRGIVELHGGVVSAASDGTGRGSTFTLRLPLADSVDTAPRRARGTRPLKVLVVDDNVDAARTLGELLQLMGHDARVVNDGEAALAQVETFTPEVSFLDLGMPSVDGYELAVRMRANRSERPRGSIVAVTGFGVDHKRARESGFDEHLVKPLSAEKLRTVLEKLTS
jgi:CheY-like chemotaxis protein